MINSEAPDAAAIQSWCVDYVARILDTPADQIDPKRDLDRLGLDSSTAVALLLTLEEKLGIEMMPELLFDYPTISALSTHLAARLAAEGKEATA